VCEEHLKERGGGGKIVCGKLEETWRRGKKIAIVEKLEGTSSRLGQKEEKGSDRGLSLPEIC